MRVLLAIFSATMLVACTVPVPVRGPFVPFSQVLQETRGRTFECTGYDVPTQTCETISVTTVRGNRLRFTAFAAIAPEAEVVQFEISGTGRIKDGLACADEGSFRTKLTADVAPELARVFEEIFDVVFNTASQFCGKYYSAPGGGYITQALLPDGQAVGNDLDTSRFFAEMPKLRPLRAN